MTKQEQMVKLYANSMQLSEYTDRAKKLKKSADHRSLKKELTPAVKHNLSIRQKSVSPMHDVSLAPTLVIKEEQASDQEQNSAEAERTFK